MEEPNNIQLPSQEQLISLVEDMYTTVIHSLSVAYMAAETDPATVMEALRTANTGIESLRDFTSQNVALTGTMSNAITELESQRDQLVTELDQAFDDLDNRAYELAEQMTQAEIDHLLDCSDCRDDVMVELLVERVQNGETVEAIREELDGLVNRVQRHVEAEAQREFGVEQEYLDGIEGGD